jgi:uncharacterized protein (TIGR03000 family)
VAMNRHWYAFVMAAAVTLLAAETSCAQVGAVFSGIGHPRGLGFGLPVGGFYPYSPYAYGVPYGFGYGSPYGYSPFGYGLGYGSPYGYGLGYGSPYGYGSFGYGYFGLYSGYTFTYTYVAAAPRGSSSSFYAPNPVTSQTALLEVSVPADAEVWFDGEKSSQTGTERSFRSKPLQADTVYTFEVKASWKENDKPVERTRKVRLMAGESISTSLLNP